MNQAGRLSQPTVVGDRVTVAEVVRPHFSELYLSAPCLDTGATAAADETRAAYQSAAGSLAARGATVVQERLFGALAARDEILAARAGALAGSAAFGRVVPLFLEGRPCDGDGLSGLHLVAIAPRTAGQPIAIEEMLSHAQPVGRTFEQEGVRFAYLSGMAAATPDQALPAPEQARVMFHRTQEVLLAYGFSYLDVARTWIYNGDILAWYGDFNQVRTAAYREFGVLSHSGGRLPASTGIQARSPGAIECAMDVLALRSVGGSLTVETLHNPLQNEAYAYGSSFSRATEVITGGVRTVYVSGTASIDEFGESIHLDDIDGQITRTVLNIEALIGARDLTLDDLCQATVFLKRADDLPRFRALCAGTRLDRVGVCMVADVCRPELLFEIDAVAAKHA